MGGGIVRGVRFRLGLGLGFWGEWCVWAVEWFKFGFLVTGVWQALCRVFGDFGEVVREGVILVFGIMLLALNSQKQSVCLGAPLKNKAYKDRLCRYYSIKGMGVGDFWLQVFWRRLKSVL